MSRDAKICSAMAFLGVAVGHYAHAEVYQTDQQAVASLFPGEKMEKKSFELTPEDSEKIHAAAKETVRGTSLVVWKNTKGDCVFIDQVLGKHEFITMAVGISKDGKVKGIEILEYRESYGQQVRGEEWRSQFVGKTSSAPLKVNEYIQNLSGATLSSAHVTGGVRRLLKTYDVIKSKI